MIEILQGILLIVLSVSCAQLCLYLRTKTKREQFELVLQHQYAQASNHQGGSPLHQLWELDEGQGQ
tara:strand:- start:533 stop:730 length:198 start_codon:yes stop_codon:yes gene_type:complete